MHTRSLHLAFSLGLAFTTPAFAQSPAAAPSSTFASSDSVIRRMWRVGMQESKVETLAQVLIDSIGPRLSGTPGFRSAVEWLERTYQGFGIPVRRHQYGTWRGWQQGATSAELIAPRHQNLEVELLAWSPGTPRSQPVEGDVVAIPALADTAAASAWIRTVRGKFILVSAPEVMCRAPQELARNASRGVAAQIDSQRARVRRVAAERFRALSPAGTTNQTFTRAIHLRLDSAGVAGIVTSLWSNGWGVNKIFGATAPRVPTIDLSCEDYGLLHRLASNNQGPRMRLTADSRTAAAEVPMFNVIAELKGRELPNEYVVLSAHLDSWHGATGATDNGTGTITMLEAMRILKEAYPNPRRTIVVGHWGSEEQGLNGSRSFVADHPQVVDGLQAAFNQDNGTWRFEMIEGQGFAKSGAHIGRWISQLPATMTDSIRIQVPGPQANAGSDHSAFICRGAPAFRLQSPYDEYRQYTWHTNRDTYDKIVMPDLRNNATIAAMMAYAASEDPDRVPRDRATLYQANGQPRSWPTCTEPRRNSADYFNPPATPPPFDDR
jgi:carboxypeptidase Q